MIRDLLILGFGGLGREIYEAARKAKDPSNGSIYVFDDVVTGDDVLDYLDDLTLWGGTIDSLGGYEPMGFCTTVGSGLTRQRLHGIAESFGHHPVSIHDPQIHLSNTAKVRQGTSILYGCLISSRAEIGFGCHMGFSSCVAHDSTLGDFVTVGPGAQITGNCVVGDRTTIGAGVVLRPGVIIGQDVTIGAGAVVVKDVPSDTTVVGNPGRTLGSHP